MITKYLTFTFEYASVYLSHLHPYLRYDQVLALLIEGLQWSVLTTFESANECICYVETDKLSINNFTIVYAESCSHF